MLPPKDFRIGPTAGGMIACRSIFGCDPNFDTDKPFPPVAPGAEQVGLLDGTTSFVGYARAIWTLVQVPVSRLFAGRQFALGSATAYSGQCYIRTLDADGYYYTWRAVARFPNPINVSRSGGVYESMQIEFILIEKV